MSIENNGGRLWTRLIKFGILSSGGLSRHDAVLRSAMKGGELNIVASQNGWILLRWVSYEVCGELWWRSWSTDIACWAQLSGFWIPVGPTDILFSEKSKLALGPSHPPVQWVPVSYPIQSGRNVKLTSYIHLVPTWRIRGATPLFPHTSWRRQGQVCLLRHFCMKVFSDNRHFPLWPLREHAGRWMNDTVTCWLRAEWMYAGFMKLTNICGNRHRKQM